MVSFVSFGSIAISQNNVIWNEFWVTVHTPLSREVFWHEYAKIPRHTSQNSIAVGNLEVTVQRLAGHEKTDGVD